MQGTATELRDRFVTGLKHVLVGVLSAAIVAFIAVLLFLAVFHGARGVLDTMITTPRAAALPLLLLLVGVAVLHIWLSGVLASRLWGWE